MARKICVAAAQMGSTNTADPREKTVDRMLKLMDEAAAKGAKVIVFPETAFTTFFPRFLIKDPVELDSYFEHGDIVTQPQTKPVFDRARTLGVSVYVGYAEKTDDGAAFNSCVYYDGPSGALLSKYRKVHLPGNVEPFSDPAAVNQLEKRYFRPGDLGFRAFRAPGLVDDAEAAAHGDPIFGMLICNDRRWAEAWRVLGLQGVEVVLCGYNTAGYAPHLRGTERRKGGDDPALVRQQALFHHKLVTQAHSYTNACFCVNAARAGLDDGKYDLISGSCITGPEGNILAEAATEGDEVVVAEIDLDDCKPGKARTFDFARHRRIEHYGPIAQQAGVVEPPRLGASATATTPATPKKIRILLVNPNSTASMTDACVALATPTLAELTGFTAPRPAPSAIESHVDNVLSAAAAVRAVLPLAATHDAVLVVCYSDHALIRMLREELPGQPVVGIMEASLAAARTLGNRFGLVATSDRSRVVHEDTIRTMGLDGLCAGVASCKLGVLDLHAEGEGEDAAAAAQAKVNAVVARAATSLVERGAEVLTLGCAGMTPLKTAVEAAVGPNVTVIDGVLAGVQFLSGLVRIGGRTAKNGTYRSSAATRKARGQDWI
ncbi:carbon-nitrogen hydrolase [Niveomyces insectorum RCEF 264]|uniref:Carbon-nitrogen hydrolase n=1 Tax=Niveomyces insectorum RCEF 264 TaxID=1081102 RepID=A0A167TXK7_9HYPO|nr:carbon-nitrogen hydrolase [Niveomyces insectorum RCEF 264]